MENNLISDKINSSFHLKQGQENLKFKDNIDKESAYHMLEIQKTSDINLSNVDLNKKLVKNLENYEKVDDFKSYTKGNDLFNKSISQYMLSKDYYIETKDTSSLNKLTNNIVNSAQNLLNNLNTSKINNSYDKKKIEQSKNNIHSIINTLNTECRMESKAGTNKYLIVNQKLNSWFYVSIISFILLLLFICNIKFLKVKQEKFILTSVFFVLLTPLLIIINYI
tara:strand:+ start:7300 stop:7968 length:669 start_codon:yes stop_codon:yes gene_type:complete